MGELQDVTANLNGAVKNTQNGTARLPEITDSVAEGTKDLPGLIRQTQASMRELDGWLKPCRRPAPAQICEPHKSAAPQSAVRADVAVGETGERVPFAEGFCEVSAVGLHPIAKNRHIT